MLSKNAELKQHEGPGLGEVGLRWGGEGQLTAGPRVPFRLLVTACPPRNVLFKTRLSSNAAYCNNKRTSSAVCEDAHAATLGDSRGWYGSKPPGWTHDQQLTHVSHTRRSLTCSRASLWNSCGCLDKRNMYRKSRDLLQNL